MSTHPLCTAPCQGTDWTWPSRTGLLSGQAVDTLSLSSRILLKFCTEAVSLIGGQVFYFAKLSCGSLWKERPSSGADVGSETGRQRG